MILGLLLSSNVVNGQVSLLGNNSAQPPSPHALSRASEYQHHRQHDFRNYLSIKLLITEVNTDI